MTDKGTTSSSSSALLVQKPPTATTTILRPFPASIPRIRSRSYLINGVPTDMWVQLFADRTVVCISQQRPQQVTTTAAAAAASDATGTISNWILAKPVLDSCNVIPTAVPLGISTLTTNASQQSAGNMDLEVSHLLGAGRNDILLSVYAKRITLGIVAAGRNSAVSGTPPPPGAVLLGLSLWASSSSTTSSSTTTNRIGGRLHDDDPAVFHTLVDLVVSLYRETLNDCS